MKVVIVDELYEQLNISSVDNDTVVLDHKRR